MSDTKKTPDKWKAEQQRAERKARLARMKSKEGGKKQIRTSNPLTRLIVIIILVIALIATGLWAAVRSGLPHRELAAVTIADISLHPVDVNYYYFQQLSNYGLDPANPESQATLRAPSGMPEFKTNADFLKDQAVQQLQKDVLLAEQARQIGLALTEEDAGRINSYITSLASTATREGKTLENYLITSFGSGMNEAALRRCVERMLLAELFAREKRLMFAFSDAELQAAYDENPDQYDLVDYRTFYHAAVIKSGATSAERTKAMEEARMNAEEMLDRITDEDSFSQLSIEYAPDNEKEAYRDADITLLKNMSNSSVNPVFIRNWLFDAERKTGEKSVIESTSGYYVVMFLGRRQADYQRVNVRHILIAARRATETEEKINAARQKAESILAEYRGGEKTEDAFAELAKLNTDDGNAEQGGLYEGVFLGQMVAEFEDWCFDPSRKTGDTGLVQTDFGFHVMYYVGANGVDWKLRAEKNLQDKAYQDYLTELVKQNPYKVRAFGYRFAG